MSKPPIFHPYTTNTGQTLMNSLIKYPRTSMWLQFNSGGAGVPVSPLQIETSLPEVILYVCPQVDILVGMSATEIPVLGAGGTIIPDTIVLCANESHILQWPSQYFTPIPLEAVTDPKYIFINTLAAQNSSGDAYKLDNR